VCLFGFRKFSELGDVELKELDGIPAVEGALRPRNRLHNSSICSS